MIAFVLDHRWRKLSPSTPVTGRQRGCAGRPTFSARRIGRGSPKGSGRSREADGEIGSEHIAEWVRLTNEKLAQVGPVSNKGGRGMESGTRAAARELGVERHEAQRAVKIDSITPEAKEAAREAGIAPRRKKTSALSLP